MQGARLTWEQLQHYDPAPNTRGAQARYLCPFCGDSKPRDDRHRSLSVDPKRGVYHCHRCGTSGKIQDARTPTHPRRRVRSQWRPPPEPEPTESLQRAHQWEYMRLRGTPGEDYLRRRGIALRVAERAGVRFCAQFGGGEAVVFPFRDRQGRLLAVQGRYLADGQQKVKTYGAVSRAVFASDKEAWRAPVLAVCEAPIDALSLQMCGVPAFAVGGTGLRRFLLPVLGIGRTVLLAFDADGAGDSAAKEWQGALEPFACQVKRLRPPVGKDWNECLQTQGQQWVQAHLGAFTAQERGASPSCPRCGAPMEWFRTLLDWVCVSCYFYAGGASGGEGDAVAPAGAGYGRCARCGGVLDCSPDGVLYCVECRWAQ